MSSKTRRHKTLEPLLMSQRMRRVLSNQPATELDRDMVEAIRFQKRGTELFLAKVQGTA